MSYQVVKGKGGSCGYVHDDDLILVQPREGTFMTDQRSVSSMPGVTLTFVLADGPGEGLRSPVSTVTPSSSMVDFGLGRAHRPRDHLLTHERRHIYCGV